MCFANLRFRIHIHHVCILNMYIIVLTYHYYRIICREAVCPGMYVLICILKTYSYLFCIWLNFRKLSLTLLPPFPYNYALAPQNRNTLAHAVIGDVLSHYTTIKNDTGKLIFFLYEPKNITIVLVPVYCQQLQ